MKNIINHEAAPAVSSAGSTGSEAREGAPADLEFFLQDYIKGLHHEKHLQSYGLAPNAIQTMDLLSKEAYAFVENGHIHVGLIYSDAISFLGPIFLGSEVIRVSFEYGGAQIHSPLMAPSWPLFKAATERTIWDNEDGKPCAITQASLYTMHNGRLVKFGTKPAHSYIIEDDELN